MRMIREIGKIKVFLLTSLLFILVGILFILLNEKTAIHLAINAIHSPYLNAFFKYYTYVGDGATTALAVLILGFIAFKKLKYTPFILGWLTLIFCGVFSQALKRLVYPEAKRPLSYIGENLLYLVPDVDVHSANSFPSGHTTAAFGFFACVAILFFKANKSMQLFMAFLAILVGYSRMYLSQHFLEDVVAGALLGLLSFMLAYWIVSLLPGSKKNLNIS